MPRPKPNRYLGKGPFTEGHRLRFWSPALRTEEKRLDVYTQEKVQLEVLVGATEEGHPMRLLSRRRRLGHNSWLHRASHHGVPEEVAWLSPSDCHLLGLSTENDRISIRSEVARIELAVIAKQEVLEGTVVVPHGLPTLNINRLIPSNTDCIGPLSGQHFMTGTQVWVRGA